MASANSDEILNIRSLKNVTIHLDSINSLNKNTPGQMTHMLSEFNPIFKETDEVVVLELVDFYFVNSFYNIPLGENSFQLKLVEAGETVETILDNGAIGTTVTISPGNYSLNSITTILNVVSPPLSTSNYTITAFSGNESTLRNTFTTSGAGVLYCGVLNGAGTETLRKLGFIPKRGDLDPQSAVVRPNGYTWYPINVSGLTHTAQYTMDLRSVASVAVTCSRIKSPLYGSSHGFRSSGVLLIEPVKALVPNLQHEIYSQQRKSFILNNFETGLYEFNLIDNETGKNLDTQGLSWGLTFELHYVRLERDKHKFGAPGNFENVPSTFEAQAQIDKLNAELDPRKRRRV